MTVYYLTVCYKTNNPDTRGYIKKCRYLDKDAAQRVYLNYLQNDDIDWVEYREVNE